MPDLCLQGASPLKKSPNASKVATPRRFGVPSLDIQLAETSIVSVPADLGGWTCAYVANEVLPVFSPAAEKLACRYSDRLIISNKTSAQVREGMDSLVKRRLYDLLQLIQVGVGLVDV